MEDFKKTFLVEEIPDETIHGGLFYRTMKLGRFIKDCEEKGYFIVGLRVNESNNGELLFIKKD